nr:hypothetical protein [uncultured Mediterranean phage uvMED]BAR26483.1 hypothetical protein [uncultured Mediterranean phage uvMED]BAR26576.1 hypothetical protein [uncultured Mediterranean phage uvMED]BAR26718.1 hypothetical protein [uncultured Mediterranean phage uvMED]
MKKFTNLEIEIITDRPEECIVECSCDFYEDYLIKVYGDRNTTKDIIIEYSYDKEGVQHIREVFPEQAVEDSCHKLYRHLHKHKTLPELDKVDKMVLDDCLSGSTADRADDVSPQYGGKVAATARRIIDKLEKLGVEFSYVSHWY